MSYRGGLATGIVSTLLAVGTAAGVWWLAAGKAKEPAKSPPPPVPAVVAKEEDFYTVTLKPEAVRALRLDTGEVRRESVPRTRFYGGEVTTPPGRTIVVAAPFAGTLRAAESAPRAGATVSKGQVVFEILPLLTPEGRANLAAARVEAEGQVKNAETQLEAADVALKRAKKLLMDEAGSRRMLDEAEAAFNLAEKTLEAARARRTTFVRIAGEAEKGTAAPLPIDVPADGLLRQVTAAAGQSVPAGATLFEVLDTSVVWVRVAVFVGDEPQIHKKSLACVGDLAGGPAAPARAAPRVVAPPSADPAAGTVDLFFELANPAFKYRPGELVGVTLRLTDEAVSLTVPWSAVVYDINGGAWVYEVVTGRPDTYTRRRVVVHRVVGDEAVLEAGPDPGTRVVTDGAAELFGTETGYSK